MARYGRVIRYLLWGACLAALLVGCGNLSLMAPREPVTIRFAGPGADGSLDALIEEFQKTHKHVVIEVVTENIYRFEQLEDIDIILVPNFILPELIEREYPISLDALMQGDKDFDPDDIYAVADAAMSIEGRRWAVPYMLDATMMFYNRDLFDRYGVPYPTADWTWDDLLERARLLTHADRGEYGFAHQQSGNPRDTELMLLIYQHGGQLYDDLETPTRMILNDPNTVMALQWYADLIYRHYVAPPPGQRTPPYPLQGIEEGRYAMWTGSFSDAWQDLNVGRAALPRNRTALTFGSVLGFVISADAQDPQACWEWVSYLT